MAEAAKKTALVVDDEEDIRRLLKSLLESSFPVRVIETTDGSDAHVKMTRQKFDLVITDIKMPKMDGMSLVNVIRGLDLSLRPKLVIVLSAFLESEYIGKEQEHIKYLEKPFDEDRILMYASRVLGGADNQKSEPYKVDVNFINPFIKATLRVLLETCRTEAVKENIFLRTKGQISGDISAVVPMNSQYYQGSMAVSFTKKCFLGIIERMLGEKSTTITEEFRDAAGEICNQIFGLAKTELNEMGHQIQSAIPTVISGDNHEISHMIVGPCVAVRFSTQGGESFTIEAVIGQ